MRISRAVTVGRPYVDDRTLGPELSDGGQPARDLAPSRAVHDLALLPSACVALIRLRTNERQTLVIAIAVEHAGYAVLLAKEQLENSVVI